MNGKKIIWIVVAVVVAIGSFLAGVSVGNKGTTISQIATGGDYQQGFNAAMEQARKKVSESGIFPMSPKTVNTISGTVKSVNGNSLVITVNGRVSPNPLDEQGPVERTVMVGDKTVISAQVAMTADEQSAQMKKYNEAMKGSTKNSIPPPPPVPFTEKIVAVDAIKIGMFVTVTSDDDIKLSSTINASKINFSAVPTGIEPGMTVPAPSSDVIPPPPATR